MHRRKKMSPLSSILSLKSISPRGNEFPMMTEDANAEESDVNLLYVDKIENMKRILFPATNDFTQMSPRARLCIAHVEEELFELKRKRNEILRRESELIYTLQDTLLDEECDKLREDVRKLAQISDEKKTMEQRARESELLQQIINIVNKRNILLLDLHIERLREMEEDEELREEYKTHKVEWMKLVGSLEDIKGKRNIRTALAAWLEHMGTKFHLTAKSYVID